MSDISPYTPPQSNVSAAEPEADIESLPVSDVWKKRFRWLRKAGGPSMPNIKNMSRSERREYRQFNVLGFLFGPFYYFAKGMWKKGISLFLVCVTVIVVLAAILEMLGIGRFASALGYGASAVFSVRANIDYYKKMVLRSNGWW